MFTRLQVKSGVEGCNFLIQNKPVCDSRKSHENVIFTDTSNNFEDKIDNESKSTTESMDSDKINCKEQRSITTEKSNTMENTQSLDSRIDNKIVTAYSSNRNNVENTMITDINTENNNSNNMEQRSLTKNNNKTNNDNKNIDENTTNANFNTSNKEAGVFGSNNSSNNVNYSTTTINRESRISTFTAAAAKCQQKYYEIDIFNKKAMSALAHKLIKREKNPGNPRNPSQNGGRN
ncbi:putative uncharacterized protein DDB_G0277255 isoform X2 [Octopus bimaculoides]|uniref:Uncharacterized protein n=1 Tax=Octopus bimaculoides TaxID=37653 RepID=A0A0L8FUM1_OCTBM|nr:putative uncharacterized protein DDB_G0277255 isoform X2 [Octopus bimaculoides]